MLQKNLFGEMEGLLNEARARIETTKVAERKVQGALIQARSTLDRLTRDQIRNQKQEEDATAKQTHAREMGTLAQKNAEEAKYKETPQTRRQAEYRYKNEARRWLTEADQVSRTVRRWEDESKIKDRHIQAASEKIEDLEEEARERRKEVYAWEQRVLRLGQLVGKI